MEAPTRPTVLLPVTTLAVTSNGEIPHIPTRAASIASKSSRKKRNRKKRARQWTYYIDTLKSAIDGLYEICRSEHSVAGCREAMLYLQSASNDFKSLIESINVEVEFTTASNEKRPSVAWEIRKSMSSPSHMVINEKLVNNSPLLPISVLAEAVRNANVSKEDASDQSSPAYLPIKDLNPNNISYARITAAAVAVVAAAANASEQHHEDGWQVVRSRRRKSASSTTASEFDREMSLESDYAPTVPLNVYERLSSGIGSSSCRRGKYSASSSRNIPSPTTTSSARLTCPRSAMDLPQTKASMAKMAYSRQLLWEKNQHALYEKLRARQKREKVATNTQHHQSSTSLTVVATTEPGTHVSRARSTCGFTFADPLAVRKSVEAYTQQKRQQQHKQKAVAAPEAEHALQSINENDEPATSAAPPEAKELMSTSMTSDEVPADPKPKSPEPLEVLDQEKRKELPSSSQSLRAPTPGSTSSNFVEGSTTSAPAVLLLETSAAFVEDDVVWREMTEEEESLALEENSLKFEIEKAESLSFDVELEKQVCSEAAQLEKLHRREKRRNVKRSRETEKEARNPREMRHFMPPPSDATPLEKKFVSEELQTLATVAWSELMNQSVPMGPVHEPGTLVERHEKMSSPSRRKCDKDDDDFGRRHEEKLRRADELRSQLQEERAARVKELTKRVEEVRAKKLAIQEKKRKLLEERMQRATENRETHLTEIVRKAKDDDQKVHEVLFINTLQGDAKRHELMMKTRSDDASHEEKKKQLADERARKMEEKAAKEAAAVARRREVAMARENRLKSLVVEKEARISQRAAEQEEKKRIKRESTKNGPKASVIPTNPNIAETTEKFDEK
ncbi:unnamed protein product [Caenorhabditis auriculariae]|uniref:S phase cyclin A-associated protein in the endoplasmic reticulum N-terminal domain-containing protein n=1 Tax=Caenorhabditis auriculariae TaxID=2777116 RepID=A0A8S1HST8_9PELO|nr:unnamed protein product [Caenorhabditis auriculariae]